MPDGHDERIAKMRAFIIQFAYYCIILLLIYAAFRFAAPLFGPFIAAFFVAFLLKPLINFIAQRTGIRRKVVAVLSLIVFYILFIALLIVVGTRLVLLVRDAFAALPDMYAVLIKPALDGLQNSLIGLITDVNPEARSMITELSAHISTALSGFFSSLSTTALGALGNTAVSVPSVIVNTIIMIVASFFFAADYASIANFIAGCLPERGREMLFRVKNTAVEVLFKFLRAYLLLMILTFVELLIGLTLLRVEYALLLSLFIAVVDILPVLGTGTVLIPWGVVALILGNVPQGIGILILYGIITVVRQSLEPHVVGQQIGLHPLVTLMCIFVGASLFGIVGLFGVPVAVTIFMQVRREDRAAHPDGR